MTRITIERFGIVRCPLNNANRESMGRQIKFALRG